MSDLIWNRAAFMERVMDDKDLAREVITLFIETIPEQIEKLRDYLNAGDVEKAERMAHRIKGSAANMGGEELRALAFEMEKIGKTGDLDGVRSRVDGLGSAVDRLVKALKDF